MIIFIDVGLTTQEEVSLPPKPLTNLLIVFKNDAVSDRVDEEWRVKSD